MEEHRSTARGLQWKHLSREQSGACGTERRSSGMTQHTPIGVEVANGDPRGAPIVLESRGLKKTYGSGEKSISVLADANLILRQGEMVAIVAPSGAGKSTLLHLLATLDTPTSGTVYFATKAIE